MARAHRKVAYVPADVALWPHLTGAEILELLARTGPGTDAAYQGELVDRFALDLAKPARAYSTGNRQKVALVAAFATRAPLLVLDEPRRWPRTRPSGPCSVNRSPSTTRAGSPCGVPAPSSP